MSRVKSRIVLRASEIAACLGLVSLVMLCGCSSVKVRLGWRISLDKTPIASMEVSQFRHPGIGPGEKSSLVVTLAQPNGTVLVTEGKGKGKVLWKDLTITASVVSADKKGVLSLPRDPRVSDGKMGHVTITVPSHPGISADLDIPLRYDYKFVSSFSGNDGINGVDGTDGIDGFERQPGLHRSRPSFRWWEWIERDQWIGWSGWRRWRGRAASASSSDTQIGEPSITPGECLCSRSQGAVLSSGSPGRLPDGERLRGRRRARREGRPRGPWRLWGYWDSQWNGW